MLTDRSEIYIETWKFLDRRLDDIKSFGEFTSYFKAISSVTLNGILGMTSILKWNDNGNMDRL